MTTPNRPSGSRTEAQRGKGVTEPQTDERTEPSQPGAAPQEGSGQRRQADGPERWTVRLSHPAERRRQVFSSVSESRARRFISNRYPRGEEAYLEGPDGNTYSYQHERTGEHGEDAEQWGDFDPDNYRPPEEQSPPGEASWQDVEG